MHVLRSPRKPFLGKEGLPTAGLSGQRWTLPRVASQAGLPVLRDLVLTPRGSCPGPIAEQESSPHLAHLTHVHPESAASPCSLVCGCRRALPWVTWFAFVFSFCNSVSVTAVSTGQCLHAGTCPVVTVGCLEQRCDSKSATPGEWASLASLPGEVALLVARGAGMPEVGSLRPRGSLPADRLPLRPGICAGAGEGRGVSLSHAPGYKAPCQPASWRLVSQAAEGCG